MNDDVKIKNIFTVICIIALLLAIPSIWPYVYYQLLRWLVSGTAIFILYTILEFKKRTWTWIMAITAILFNPIIPIHLMKETWVIIDFIVAVVFIISLLKIKKK